MIPIAMNFIVLSFSIDKAALSPKQLEVTMCRSINKYQVVMIPFFAVVMPISANLLHYVLSSIRQH
jgi:hypothetical protein